MSRWTLVTSKSFDKSARRIDRASLERIRDYMQEVTALTDPRARAQSLSREVGPVIGVIASVTTE